jgi:hypothetical protein
LVATVLEETTLRLEALMLQETTPRPQALMQLVLSIATRKKRRTVAATSGCTEPVVPLLVLQVVPCS